jgi:3-hydroxyisobutyrate dehydrogenase-like beta-hydroxyacid dehydrogenase
MTIAVIGLGTMGTPIARRLRECGFNVVVWNRSPEKAEPFRVEGIPVAESPAAAAAGADTVISSVLDDAALREVSLGPGGILEGLGDTAVHCDTSTISPKCAREIHAAYGDAGKRFIHAPVLGSKKQVAAGELLIFAEGPMAAVEAARPALEALGKRIWELREPGSAAALKLACNMMIAGMITTLSQSLVFACKHGLDPRVFLDVIQSSALAAPMYASKSRQILERDWSANFFVDNLIKDIVLARRAAAEAGLDVPLLALQGQLFEAASAAGYGRDDYSAVYRVFEEMAGLEDEERPGREAE